MLLLLKLTFLLYLILIVYIIGGLSCRKANLVIYLNVILFDEKYEFILVHNYLGIFLCIWIIIVFNIKQRKLWLKVAQQ